MSLTTCRECGKEISTKADACPNCGARRKRSIGTGGLIVSAILAVTIYNCSPSSLYSLYSLPPAGSTKHATPSQIPAPPVAGREIWIYDSVTDQISGKEVTLATLRSANHHDLRSPYGPGIGARLEIRKHPRLGKDVMVSIDKGQILCRSYNPCTIAVRFDERPAIQFRGLSSATHESDTVFIENFQRFTTELARAKTVIIELPIYQDGNLSWTFTDDFSMTRFNEGQ